MRMLQRMRGFWNDLNRARRERVQAEVEVAKARQAEVEAFWDQHKITVKGQWADRTGGRGKTMVADIPDVAKQSPPCARRSTAPRSGRRVHSRHLGGTASPAA